MYYLKYQNQKIYLSTAEYHQLSEALSIQRGTHIEFKGQSLKKTYIEILKGGVEQETDRLNDFEYREEVKQFEKDFQNWKEKNPQYQGKPFLLERYSASLGAIRIKIADDLIDIVVVRQKE
jgi:hypothetical protein